LLLDARAMRSIRLVLGFAASACAPMATYRAQLRPTAAFAAGAQSTSEGGADFDSGGDDEPHGSGPFVDVEAGARIDRVAVVAFARYARYTDSDVEPSSSSDPDVSAIVHDIYFGARVHVWPARWFRIGIAAGGDTHREYDDVFDAPPGYSGGNYRVRETDLFFGLDAALIPFDVGRGRFELGADLGEGALDSLVIDFSIGVRI
jgi:hypothetical protein